MYEGLRDYIEVRNNIHSETNFPEEASMKLLTQMLIIKH